jgi:N-acetylneuraminate lyase
MKVDYLGGLIAAPFTPMLSDGSVNLAAIESYYKMLKGNGVHAAFICGSTGESASLSMDEKKAIAETWVSCTSEDKNFKVISFLGGTCLADCKELALHAKQIGLHAVALTSPFYFKPDNIKVIAEICEEVAAVVPDMPFYYYHIPVLTGVNFPMIDLLKEVDGKISNFAGIKYSHEDFRDFQSCINHNNRKFQMMWGRDENMLPALSVGTKYFIGSTYNYAAPLYLKLMDAFKQGNLEEANALQQKSIDMIRLLGKYSGVATGKAFMKLAGLDCGVCRLPNKNLSHNEQELLSKDVDELGLLDMFKINHV